MEKTFISAGELLRDSFLLAANIYDSGFRPDFIVGIWRGGTPVGIAVQEYFEFRGAPTDHIAVRTASYTGIAEQSHTIRVHGLHYLLDNANADNSVLVVDDVFDSGRSFKALLDEWARTARCNLPKDIRLAAPWYKPSNRKVDLIPDYFVRETDQWLVFPHEMVGLTEAEIRAGKSDLAGMTPLFFSP